MRTKPLIGAVYGTGLLVTGWLLAGGGHGTMLPVAISAAPFALVSLPLAFLVLVPFWTLLFSLSTRRRLIVVALLVLHYAGVFCVLAGMSDLADWEYLYRAWHRVPALLAFILGWYVTGKYCWVGKSAPEKVQHELRLRSSS